MPANLDRSIRTATVVVSQTGLVDISRFSSWNRLLKQPQSSASSSAVSEIRRPVKLKR